MPIIDLSHVLRTGMDVFPGDRKPEFPRLSEHGEGNHQSSAMNTGCHVGTHIDTPLHFLPDRPGLDQMPADRFIGRAAAIDAPAGVVPAEVAAGIDLGPVDFLILRTGWENRWGTPGYYRDWPYLHPDLARHLADAGLKGVGIDSPSVDPLSGGPVHGILAAAGMINVENLANLGALPAGIFDFMALPLKLAGAEGSPVRAVALV